MKTIPHAVPITELDADAIVIPVLAEPSLPGGATHAVDRALGGLVGRLHARGDLDAAVGRVTPLFAEGGIAAPRVLVVGLGSAAALDAEAVRRAAAAALRRARAFGAKRVGVAPLGAGLADLDFAAAAAATVEGARLGLYRYAQDRGVDELMLAVDEARLEAAHDAVRWAEAVAEGVELARELVNRPPNVATPEHLAEVARGLAEDHGFAVTIGDRAWAEERAWAPSSASRRPPATSRASSCSSTTRAAARRRRSVLVGKGVTFDSGGVSIKGRQGMEGMKGDMAGAAAVLGAMRTLGRLRSPRRVVAFVPATENVLDAHAYRPSDVLTAANGTTIEIISTDAEGRLLLADALAYARATGRARSSTSPP
jgi:leucyl aminopeptidase